MDTTDLTTLLSVLSIEDQQILREHPALGVLLEKLVGTIQTQQQEIQGLS